MKAMAVFYLGKKLTICAHVLNIHLTFIIVNQVLGPVANTPGLESGLEGAEAGAPLPGSRRAGSRHRCEEQECPLVACGRARWR